ncbi:hypothetical protein CDAR_571871 [Caerostris darwini]|uniref:Uncharacterized protein n=1 Tax=Caerostris darwini TaxID=1538125 RepID=A0AAV4PNN2_9ARAC|nr:hypothetical protein CDAR_571871 [Caerostris darwini]
MSERISPLLLYRSRTKKTETFFLLLILIENWMKEKKGGRRCHTLVWQFQRVVQTTFCSLDRTFCEIGGIFREGWSEKIGSSAGYVRVAFTGCPPGIESMR